MDIISARDYCLTLKGAEETTPFGPDWKTSLCESCGNCANVCPTGALVAKNHKKYQISKVKKVLMV